MAEFFDCPPILQGEAEEQLQQLYAYLGTVSDKLNSALMTITIEQMTPETQEAIRYAGGEKSDRNTATLKELIIKSANVVRTEMDEIRTQLERNITAVSDEYGELYENLRNDVDLNAEGLTQVFSSVTTITDEMGNVAERQQEIDSFIKVGRFTPPGESDEVTGVAIGEGNDIYAAFTENELAFYMNNTKVAYFSSNIFHIANGEITQTLKMGNHIWKIMSNGAFALIAGS